jgi:RNA 2',3'-cyclic 3'-phosphodiesterase
MTALRSVDSDEIVLHRLFFALMPSAEVVPEIAAVRGGLGIAKSHVLDHRLHLTLWSLDLPMTPPPGIIADLCAAAARVEGPALRLVLHELVGNGHVTCLRPGEPMPVLKAFQQRLQLAAADGGLWPNRGFRFDPHMTLAYGQAEGVRRPVWPISWRAEDFVLVHSLVGLTEHVVLGRWRLG